MTRSTRTYLATALLLVAACIADGGSPATTSEPPSTSILESTTTSAGEESVDVFFGVEGSAECDEVQAFPRQISSDQDPIQGAFDALLAGPLESETGASSWFSEATAGSVRSTELSDGVLTVDLDNLSTVISGASSSCGSAAFLAQLTATGFQFEQVNEIIFEFEGSCESLFSFLQMECSPIQRQP